MKSVILNEYGGPEVMQVAEKDIPVPGEGELLLKMAAAGVSKPDYLMRTGAYPWTKGILPFNPGLCGAGTVVGVGGGVEDFAAGDTVFVDHPVDCGCYSEYKLCPVRCATKLPRGTDLKCAAVMTNFVIAWSLFTQVCGRGEGKTLYMKGAAGALGSAIMQLAPMAGYKTIASASTDEKCEYLKTVSRGDAFNYKTCDEKAEVLRLTDGKGADIILDQLAGDKMGGQLEMLSEMGTIIVYNYLNGCENTGILEALIAKMGKCQAVRVFSFHLNDDKPEVLKKLKNEVFSMLSKGEIKPHIFAEFPIDDIQKAHALLDSGKFTGSIILTM